MDKNINMRIPSDMFKKLEKIEKDKRNKSPSYFKINKSTIIRSLIYEFIEKEYKVI